MQRSVPRGTIALWSGSIESIPLTYRLCDGTRHTPDLRNSFIVGAGNTYSVDDTGGQLTHVHTVLSPGHGHSVIPGDVIEAGDNFHGATDVVQVSMTFDSANHLPPYHSLVYVMYDGRLR